MSRTDEAKKAEVPVPTIPAGLPRLSPGVVFEGDLTSTRDVLIQGRFKGSLRLPDASVYIDREARVEAAVTARNVYLYGSLLGPVQAAECVFISAAAEMKGDIAAARLFIQDGARFRGSVQTAEE